MKYLTGAFLLLSCNLFAMPEFEKLEDNGDVGYYKHGKHSYIIFFDKYMVHDPDCACSQRMKGKLEDGREIILDRSFVVPRQ